MSKELEARIAGVVAEYDKCDLYERWYANPLVSQDQLEAGVRLHKRIEYGYVLTTTLLTIGLFLGGFFLNGWMIFASIVTLCSIGFTDLITAPLSARLYQGKHNFAPRVLMPEAMGIAYREFRSYAAKIRKVSPADTTLVALVEAEQAMEDLYREYLELEDPDDHDEHMVERISARMVRIAAETEVLSQVEYERSVEWKRANGALGATPSLLGAIEATEAERDNIRQVLAPEEVKALSNEV